MVRAPRARSRAAVATWFVVQAVLDAASPLGPRLEAITGFMAIVVLLVVLNWFVHKVYWSEWIGRHHRQRRTLLARAGLGATFGLVALGFTSVYREGFEVVLFLQNLQLKAGRRDRARGRRDRAGGDGGRRRADLLAAPQLPYRRMLVLTGVLVGMVLVVMIGGTALSFLDLGWLPRHATPFTVPDWLGSWFEMYSTWETLGAQVLAAAFVSALLPRRVPEGDASAAPQACRPGPRAAQHAAPPVRAPRSRSPVL